VDTKLIGKARGEDKEGICRLLRGVVTSHDDKTAILSLSRAHMQMFMVELMKVSYFSAYSIILV
jgi:hypothetical protein